jgi:hypothetical protein
MGPRSARLLTRLYPRAWRERYGAEFERLLESEPGGVHAWANIVCSAFCERVFPTQGGEMEAQTCSFGVIVKQPSAFVPMAMSLIALAEVLGTVAIFGVVHRADEGAAAHIWQILMAGQMPLLLFFAIKWLPRAPRHALYVLALEAAAVLAAMAPVYFLGL